MVAFLEKSTGSAGFHQIIDFLNQSHICYALTKKPKVCVSFIKQFWRSAEASNEENGEVKIHATIDGHSLSITEGSLRRHLKLADQDGITSIPTTEIFEQSAMIGVLEADLMQTKKTYSSAYTKLILRVKKLKAQTKVGKARRQTRVVLSDTESCEKASEELVLCRCKKDTASEEVPIVSTAEYIIYSGGTVTYSRRSAEKRSRQDKGKSIMIEEEPKKKSKKELIKEGKEARRKWSTEKVMEEEIGTQEELKQDVKEPAAKRKKSIPRKTTRKRQKLEEDAEKDELKGFLDIVPREEAPIEVESISTKFPIVNWKTCVLTETFMYYQVFRGEEVQKEIILVLR
ncbi:hypothetical protein Tco_1114277 [Tanacetum coccineum]|uniref:Uncharacterized protein n=1 Tax=Tanacetum coccineum TaxID=301880 RepID=A0ABQ5IUP8_9ASTR